MTTEQTTTTPNEVLLIDLSSIAYPIWHMNQGDPNPNSTSQKIVAKVRDLARDHKHAAICKDSGRSFRKDLTDTYKANRPESDATLQHQIKIACQALEHEGFPIWAAKGFEADDILGTAAVQAVGRGLLVVVCSDDKDLLQLVDDTAGIRQFRPTKAVFYDAAKVKEEYGVEPKQIVDYLSLVGDASDNIYGAKGIGPKTASVLLSTYGSLVGVYNALKDHPTLFKPSCATALKEFSPRVPLVQQLVELRFDAPLEFDQVLAERTPTRPASNFDVNALDDDEEEGTEEPADDTGEHEGGAAPDPEQDMPHTVVDFPPRQSPPTTISTSAPVSSSSAPVAPSQAPAIITRREPPAKTPEVVNVSYEMALDPRNLKEARVVAMDMLNSGMFAAYGSAEGVLASIMLGRELGIPCMTALRQIHIIEGRQALSAQLMVALVLKSGFAEYFEPVELSPQKCTWTTHRRGSRNPFTITHTIEMADKAGLLRRDREGNLKESNWTKNPEDMLTARCSSRLARMIYPDVVGNLYTPEELQEIREQNIIAAKAVGA
jgi:5'-3' exonuclease